MTLKINLLKAPFIQDGGQSSHFSSSQIWIIHQGTNLNNIFQNRQYTISCCEAYPFFIPND